MLQKHRVDFSILSIRQSWTGMRESQETMENYGLGINRLKEKTVKAVRTELSKLLALMLCDNS